MTHPQSEPASLADSAPSTSAPKVELGHVHCYCGCTGCGVSRHNAEGRAAGCRCEGGCEKDAEPGLPLCRECRMSGCRPHSALIPQASTSTEHDWRKYEPVTVGASPVWVCGHCGQYRTQKPMAYDIGMCP